MIIDANKFSAVFAASPTQDAIPVLDWLYKKDGKLVYGGKLIEKEFKLVSNARKGLLQLARAGRARKCSNATIDLECNRLVRLNLCLSNDQHVIALARVSGARVLYSDDENLHRDFKNKSLIDHPRGAIYQFARHARLLRHSAACRRHL